jgi:hypothetical protein
MAAEERRTFPKSRVCDRPMRVEREVIVKRHYLVSKE